MEKIFKYDNKKITYQDCHYKHEYREFYGNNKDYDFVQPNFEIQCWGSMKCDENCYIDLRLKKSKNKDFKEEYYWFRIPYYDLKFYYKAFKHFRRCYRVYNIKCKIESIIKKVKRKIRKED